MNATERHLWLGHIGSGNGLALSGTSYYLNHYWPRFISPYGVPKPQLSMRVQRIKHFHRCNLAMQLTNGVAHMPLMNSILLKLFAGYGQLNPYLEIMGCNYSPMPSLQQLFSELIPIGKRGVRSYSGAWINHYNTNSHSNYFPNDKSSHWAQCLGFCVGALQLQLTVIVIHLML